MKILSCMLFIFSGCTFVFSAFPVDARIIAIGGVVKKEKIKIAVLDFESISLPSELGVAVADILRKELDGTGNYVAIKRGVLKRIMNKQKSQISSVVDPNMLISIGYLVDARIVVIGGIVKKHCIYTINFQVIDVETRVAKKMEKIIGKKGEEQIHNMVYQLVNTISAKKEIEKPLIIEPPNEETLKKEKLRESIRKKLLSGTETKQIWKKTEKKEKLRENIRKKLSQ
jgi:hypothetical protein